jgi:DNA-binding transcriptional ArsR family regulator
VTINSAPVQTAGLAAAVSLFRGLADPARLAILQRLVDGEARVVDLTRQLALAQSTVSGHLACLRDCGLVTARPEGQQMFYSLARPELRCGLQAGRGRLAHDPSR